MDPTQQLHTPPKSTSQILLTHIRLVKLQVLNSFLHIFMYTAMIIKLKTYYLYYYYILIIVRFGKPKKPSHTRAFIFVLLNSMLLCAFFFSIGLIQVFTKCIIDLWILRPFILYQLLNGWHNVFFKFFFIFSKTRIWIQKTSIEKCPFLIK